MIWFDNDEMNITPEVAAFLRYAPAPSREPTRALTPEIETPESGPDVITVLGWIIGLITIGVIGFFACIFVLMMIGFVGAVLSGPPGTAATTSSARPQINQSAPSTARAQRRPIVSQPGSEASVAYLPPEYDFGCLQGDSHLRFIWLHDRMPRGFAAEDRTTPLSVGTCVLFKRQNANGWRRIVSFDGKYRGYAQLFLTSYERRPMQPLFTQLIPLLRQIP